MIHFSQPLVLLALLGLVPLSINLVRRAPRIAGRAPLVLRLLAMTSLILTIGGPQLVSHPRMTYIYFVTDLSGSIPWSREELLKLMKSLAVKDRHLRYGLILFGEEPVIEQGFAPGLGVEELPTAIVSRAREGTDIAAALELALETFPKAGNKEIILLSDGIITRGRERLTSVLARAAREGVRISVYPLRVKANEVWLEKLLVPEEVPQGSKVELKLKVGAQKEAQARLLLYRDGQLLAIQDLTLRPGENEYLFHDLPPSPGVHYYRASLVSGEDAIPENNTLEAVLTVTGPEGPQVLLLGDPQESNALARLLTAGGYSFELVPLQAFNWALAQLAGYRLVILNDIELTRLSERMIAVLESYIREGGGLLLIQGRRAVKGLRRDTIEIGELERLLPISYEAREPAQVPSLALIFVLDRSASMSGRKLELLKEAAAASIEVLEKRDLIGLCAFHTQHGWIFELQPAKEKERIYERIASLQASGGTNLLPALEEAFQRLREVKAKLKHIVVFSDGKTTGRKRDFVQLVKRIRENNITLSAIGIGEAPDVEILRLLTEEGGGRLYLVRDLQELPRVTLEETQRITRKRWITGEIKVLPGPYAYLLGLPSAGPDKPPPVTGYVLTYPKTAGEVLFLTEKGDPLLSLWQYGLGRVGVLNVDLAGDWSGSWLAWEKLPQFFSQLIAQVWGKARGGKLTIRVNPRNEHDVSEITAELMENGRWANLLEVQGILSGTALAHTHTLTFELEQVAPGRYQAQINNLPQGTYLLSVSAQRGGREIAFGQKAVSIPYPEEYRRIGTDDLLLEELVSATGGSYLEGDNLPEELLVGSPVPRYKDLWPVGLSLALAAFIADLFLRKLSFSFRI